METYKPFYRVCLEAELARRCERNPRYSLRAFAGAIGLDAGALSRVLSGKQTLAVKAARRILNRLPLSPPEQSQFLHSTAQEKNRRSLLEFDARLAPSPAIEELEIDRFRAISDLYHNAILELTYLQGFSMSSRSVAKALGISVLEAKLAVERLQRLGLLEKRQGKLVKTVPRLALKDKHVSTPALRKQQRQILEKAIEALEEIPIEERCMNSITMAINPAKLPIAKKMIVDFTRSLCEVLETGKQERVYQMGISLFPLQR